MKSEYIVIKREDLYMQSGFVDQYTGKSEAEIDLISWLKDKNIEVIDEFEKQSEGWQSERKTHLAYAEKLEAQLAKGKQGLPKSIHNPWKGNKEYLFAVPLADGFEDGVKAALDECQAAFAVAENDLEVSAKVVVNKNAECIKLRAELADAVGLISACRKAAANMSSMSGLVEYRDLLLAIDVTLAKYSAE